MDPPLPPPHACLTSPTPCSRSNSLPRLGQRAGHTTDKLWLHKDNIHYLKMTTHTMVNNMSFIILGLRMLLFKFGIKCLNIEQSQERKAHAMLKKIKRIQLVWLVKSSLAAVQANDREGIEKGRRKNY